jgi:hypothetical protein
VRLGPAHAGRSVLGEDAGSRMILSTRRIEVRTPCPWRSRAQTLRSPSPTKRFEARTERIPARSSSSERKAFGPRLAGILGAASVCALWRWTVAQESRHARQTRRMP